MTLINYIYLPKSIQKVNRGVFFLYKRGVALNEESALNEVVRYMFSEVAWQISSWLLSIVKAQIFFRPTVLVTKSSPSILNEHCNREVQSATQENSLQSPLGHIKLLCYFVGDRLRRCTLENMSHDWPCVRLRDFRNISIGIG